MASSPAAARRVDSTTAAHVTGTSTADDMKACLSAPQLEALKDVAIGELLFVTQGEAEEEADDDDDGDDGEDGGDEDDDEVEREEEGDNEPAQADASNESTRAVYRGENRDGHQDDRSRDAEASSSTDGANDQASPEGDENGDSQQASDATSGATVSFLHPPRMFLVTAITRNDMGDVVDVTITRLEYSRSANQPDMHNFQIYGKDIVHNHPPDCKACNDSVSITSILTDKNFTVLKSPQGDHVRQSDHSISNNTRLQCILGCSRGWLDHRSETNVLIRNNNSPVLAWGQQEGNSLDDVSLQRPICPVCIGLALFKVQENLQHTLLTTGRVALTDAMDLQAQLNVRRLALGYSFAQFDERDWGYYFDDMEEGSGEEDGGWAQPYEHWEEAMDPNSHIKTNPASEATIKALPRKSFGEAGGECSICMQPLTENSLIIVLPCGHVQHHAECLELWLEQQETCTVCRRVVPAAKDVVKADVDGNNEERISSEDVGWPLGQFENVGQELIGDNMQEGNAEEVAGDKMDETGDEEDAADMHPGFPTQGQHELIANSTGAALTPALLSTSSWVTEDGDVAMSDW